MGAGFTADAAAGAGVIVTGAFEDATGAVSPFDAAGFAVTGGLGAAFPANSMERIMASAIFAGDAAVA